MKYGFSALLNEYQENVLNNAFQSDAFSIKKGDNRRGEWKTSKNTNDIYFGEKNSAGAIERAVEI